MSVTFKSITLRIHLLKLIKQIVIITNTKKYGSGFFHDMKQIFSACSLILGFYLYKTFTVWGVAKGEVKETI